MDKEYVFYKGANAHSCARHAFSFSPGEAQFFTVCALREKSADYFFELGYLDSEAEFAKNISDYKSLYYFNTKKEYFKKFDLASDDIVTNFTLVEKDSKVIVDYFNFMKEKKLVPVNATIDANSDDASEGGFNLVVKRSLVGIIFTGVISSVVYITLFVFAKMNKKKLNELE